MAVRLIVTHTLYFTDDHHKIRLVTYDKESPDIDLDKRSIYHKHPDSDFFKLWTEKVKDKTTNLSKPEITQEIANMLDKVGACRQSIRDFAKTLPRGNERLFLANHIQEDANLLDIVNQYRATFAQ